MTHLKLIKSDDKILKQGEEEDRSTSVKKEEEEATLKNVDQYSKFFLERKLHHPNEDYSKFFLIFTYNYYHFGHIEKARSMLKEVSVNYFSEKIISDMDEAMAHRNKADECRRKRRYDLAQKHQIEAEFFLVVVYVLPFLKSEQLIKDNDHFKKFLKDLEQKKFNLKLAPPIVLVGDEGSESKNNRSNNNTDVGEVGEVENIVHNDHDSTPDSVQS
ncbi:MAG: hypothetical protein HQK49_18940 [Oligoflexia bacterium]|nr:hypothetical protein [Oligoflexia bacterium]